MGCSDADLGDKPGGTGGGTDSMGEAGEDASDPTDPGTGSASGSADGSEGSDGDDSAGSASGTAGGPTGCDHTFFELVLDGETTLVDPANPGGGIGMPFNFNVGLSNPDDPVELITISLGDVTEPGTYPFTSGSGSFYFQWQYPEYTLAVLNGPSGAANHREATSDGQIRITHVGLEEGEWRCGDFDVTLQYEDFGEQHTAQFVGAFALMPTLDEPQ